MLETHDGLTVTILSREAHERTCGYWYTVRGRYFAHTAFRRRAGFLRWMRERGLSVDAAFYEVPERDHQNLGDDRVYTYTIAGEYRSEMHYTDDEIVAWSALTSERVSRTLSNGDYVEARITVDADGIRTVHTLNPNVRGRWAFDYRESNAIMDSEASLVYLDAADRCEPFSPYGALAMRRSEWGFRSCSCDAPHVWPDDETDGVIDAGKGTPS